MAKKRSTKILTALTKDPTPVKRYPRKHERFEPTQTDVSYWFGILNSVLFRKTLPSFDTVTIKRARGVWAWHQSKEESGKVISNLILNYWFRDKKHFVDVLAHEMVHHYQWMAYGPSRVDHGETFRVWVPRARRYNIVL